MVDPPRFVVAVPVAAGVVLAPAAAPNKPVDGVAVLVAVEVAGAVVVVVVEAAVVAAGFVAENIGLD